MHLLVVEDDPTISRFLLKGLREENHVVDLAEDGTTALRLLADSRYDAIILDVLLPGIDGMSACRRLRADGIDTPVLMLTARDAISDRIAGLDAGADDYLIKPFDFDELLARLRALTRRGRTAQRDARLSCGPITMDTEAHQVTVRSRIVELSATEYRLLEHLLQHVGAIVSREQLGDHVWGGDYDPFSNLADVYVGYLRRKLKAAGLDEPLIQTVRGMGYMLRTRATPEGQP